MDLFDFRRGSIPLLISIPHAGTRIPHDVAQAMTPASRALPDTDWFVPRLYELDESSAASLLIARISRYVVDLNRPPSDENLYPGQNTTALCPERHFDGTPVYREGCSLNEAQRQSRLQTYWQPYHQQLQAELDRLVDRFGFAVLLDAHSIASRVPNLFPGRLPDLNFGTNHGRSCTADFQQKIEQLARQTAPLDSIVNGRFVGGYITRHYGRPTAGVNAVQLEISQAAYLDEPSRSWNATQAAVLQAFLRRLLRELTP